MPVKQTGNEGIQLPRLVAGVALVLVAALFSGCRWENPNAAEEESDREEVETMLQGTWESLCQFLAGDDEEELWARDAYTFAGSSVVLVSSEYPDSSCSDADLAVESRGDFEVGPEVVAQDGQQVREIDFDFTEVEVNTGDTEQPPAPERRYDILSLRSDDSGFFLGERDATHDGETPEARPVRVDFSREYRDTSPK
jgi:hypothetical protein